MATRKFIKMYNIRHEDIDDKGNINPDAALYPMYMGQYIDNRTGKTFNELPPEMIDDKLSDVDKPYDDSTNAHPDRIVHVMDATGNVIKTVGPNLKRGYSALAFTNKDKRHGDDYFSGWRKVDPERDVHSVVHTAMPDIINSSYYKANYGDAEGDAGSLATSITPGERYKGFYTVPLIIEADDQDIINYNDVAKDNYDPTRDYLPEVQLKRIIRKSIVPNAFTDNTKAMYIRKVGSFGNYLGDALTKLENYEGDLDGIATSTQDVKTLYIKLYYIFENSLKFCTKAYTGGTSVTDVLGNLANTNDDVDTQLANIDYVLDNIADFASKLKVIQDRFAQDEYDMDSLKLTAKILSPMIKGLRLQFDTLYEVCGDLYDCLSELSDVGPAIRYAPNMDVVKEATRRGGAFDWHDSSTYSDERLKNIYGGCRDVTLSDKQLKYIYDDFRKFKKGATQSSITKGMRELGQ